MEIDIVHHRTARWEKDSQRKPGSAASKQGRDSQWACAMILLVGWTPIRECQVVLKCKSQHPRPCRLDWTVIGLFTWGIFTVFPSICYIQRKDMNPKDDDVDEGKICPHCRKTFLSHSTRNKHMQNYVCHKSLSRTSVSSRNSPPPNLSAILLQEDLLMGHTCPYTILPSATAPYRAGYEHLIDFIMIKMYHLCLHLKVLHEQ